MIFAWGPYFRVVAVGVCSVAATDQCLSLLEFWDSRLRLFCRVSSDVKSLGSGLWRAALVTGLASIKPIKLARRFESHRKSAEALAVSVESSTLDAEALYSGDDRPGTFRPGSRPTAGCRVPGKVDQHQ